MDGRDKRAEVIIDLTLSDEETPPAQFQNRTNINDGLPKYYPPILPPGYSRSRPATSSRPMSTSSTSHQNTGASINGTNSRNHSSSRPITTFLPSPQNSGVVMNGRSSKNYPAHSLSQDPILPPAKRQKIAIGGHSQAPIEIKDEEDQVQSQEKNEIRSKGFTGIGPREKDLLSNVLKYQIYPHIRSRVADYQDRLRKADAEQIGRLTAAELVQRRDFMGNFVPNGHRLLPGYEETLANAARAIVDRYASDYIARYNLQSASSDDSDGFVFESELPAVRPPQTNRVREYSSSPATSFSADGHLETMPEKRKRPRRSIRSGVQTERPQKKTRQSLIKAYLGEDITRPYISVLDRQEMLLEADHFDFLPEEILFICATIQSPSDQIITLADSTKLLTTLLAGKEISKITSLVHQKVQVPGPELGRTLLRCRSKSAISSFLEDAANHRLVSSGTPLEVFRRCRPCDSTQSLTKLLRAREILGISPLPTASGRRMFKIEASSCLEDSLAPCTEWFDCCGDIATISWTSDDAFICGATAHSDNSNMQYNKPGNLLLGSLPISELRSIPNHRILRPIVEADENNASANANASSWMRETQDPWLYTSVVSTSYSEALGLTFTASFDKCVKVWTVAEDGSEMKLLGTWDHENKVNFVVTSNDPDEPRVATAADVSNNAIRVYVVDKEDVTFSSYDTYSGERAQEQAQELRRRDTWAYFPATMQWGRCPEMWNLLLVGYSPRSITHDDMDIPLEKRNTGELCLWDVADGGKRISIPSARLLNVFEVLWHPTQPCFVAATSPGGAYDHLTRTQIRIFVQRQGFEEYQFTQTKTLDCSASDINELTIMPNSPAYSFITASCTDGNVYVWDTAFGDKPIHVLNHGESLDNPAPDRPREEADNGVKFSAWGYSANRFYTGSTDGKVKCWDVRAPPGKVFLRNVLEVSGGITVGAFSKDYSKLLIGDATGKVHLLAHDDSDLVDDEPITATSSTTLSPITNANTAASVDPLLRVASGNTRLGHPISQRPKAIIQHREDDNELIISKNISGRDDEPAGSAFLRQGQVVQHPDPSIGVVQGPRYHETSFFRLDAHLDNDGMQPLKEDFAKNQRCNILASRPKGNQGGLGGVLETGSVKGSEIEGHAMNCVLDSWMEIEGVDLRWDYGLDKEEYPSFRAMFDSSSS
ncbi:hypothetical protein HYALB_00000208, partial [Hymenoscyphus albidus]